MLRSTIIAALFVTALSWSTAGWAGSASGTLEVSLQVLPGCSVSAAPLAFAAQAGATSEAEAPINVRCAGDTSVALSLDGGQHSAGTQRRLVSDSGAAVPYEIYSDPARTRSWQDRPLRTGTGPDGTVQVVAYGRVEGRDSAVATGTYRDTVTVTLAF